MRLWNDGFSLRRRATWKAAIGILFGVCLVLPQGVRADEPAVEFNRDVRPILSNRCFTCHGPDSGKREAELRLDVEEEAKADRGGYAAIAAGDRESSALWERVTADDEDLRMPPGGQLSEAEIAVLGRWIDAGAEWQGHWSYLPPKRPAVPEVAGAEGLGAIDAFVRARLEAEGLKPAETADRRTLIRRLSYDLTGLPPTAADVEAFVTDAQPDAYAQLVERLLASERYGERMAMYWLDVVRYADTIGIHSDNHREVWAFRDYAIESFNRNKPFDVMTVEHLAGDLLPDSTIEQKVGSGFNRLNMTTQEGGAQPKEYVAKYSADRVRNTAAIWMGATLGCAECHDHKFDPFSTRDFYRFAAFFADLEEVAVGSQPPNLSLPSEEQTAELARLDGEIGRLRKVVGEQTAALELAMEVWEAEYQYRRGAWQSVLPVRTESANGAELATQLDGSVKATGGGETDTYTVEFEVDAAQVAGVRLEAVADEALPEKGPGRAKNGNFVVTKVEILVDGEPVRDVRATASYAQKKYGAAGMVDDDAKTGWAILDRTGQGSEAVFTFAPVRRADGPMRVTVRIEQAYGTGHTLGRFRVAAAEYGEGLEAVRAAEFPQQIVSILETEKSTRSEKQRADLAGHFRKVTPLLSAARGALAAAEKERKDVQAAVPTMLVSKSVEPRTIRILPRGNWLDDTGEVVEPGVPTFFLPEADEGERLTRMDLARWVVSEENPLTARVFVNRMWKLAFGRGIVATADDFGSQGSWPTHPELLDWLAVEFMESGWDVKHLWRLMLNSETYRQSSQGSAEAVAKDPQNALYARQSRFRLDAEMVRDTALAASGLLSPKIGGPSVKPYQPAGYWAHLNFPKRKWVHDHGESQYRRGLYTYWQRTFLHPSLLAFDAPTREECTVNRPRSNTPLQALVLLNDPTYVEAARVLAAGMIEEVEGEPAARVEAMYRQVLQRAPRSEEAAVLVGLYEKHRAEFAETPEEAAKIGEVGEWPVPEGMDRVELAAWTSVARTLLNLNETITRY